MKKEIIENQKNHIKISGSDNFLLSLYEKRRTAMQIEMD